MSVKQRDPYWDTLKGLLIILVVLGHTGTALGDNWLSVIYSFHMPLFVFVSGYFSKRTSIKHWGGQRLLLIFLLFHLAYIFLDVVSGVDVTIQRIICPSFALWYILSLLCWRLLIQILPQILLDKKYLVLVFAFMISILSGFVPINEELSFQRTCSFLPFFMLGFYARQQGWILKLRRKNVFHFVLIFIVLSAINYLYMPVFYSSSHYANLSDCVMRMVQLVESILLSIAIIRFIPSKMGIITELGKYTMLVYLLHPPMIKIMNVACSDFDINRNPLTAILMTMISVSFIYMIRNWKVLKYLK